MNRRDFLKSVVAAPLVGAALPAVAEGEGKFSPMVGKPLPPWKTGEFQIHFIYTGVAESQFWIMPDGTTMLLDCGDHPAYTRGKKALWLLPNGTRHAGEWIARYVARVNPAKTDVDYMMISHHHADHQGRAKEAGMKRWREPRNAQRPVLQGIRGVCPHGFHFSLSGFAP